MTTSEKVAYLKGLAEGLGVDKETKEGRILDAILDILEDVAHDIEDLEENAWELGEAIDQVSDDLSDIEDIVYDLDEDEDDDEDEDECCGCCCEALQAARRFSPMQPVATTNYLPKVDGAKCVGCGKCAKVCPIFAVSLEEAAVGPEGWPQRKLARINGEICLGCGVCARNCPTKAIAMERRPVQVITPVNSTHRFVLQAIEKGTLQNLIFDNQAFANHRAMAAVFGVILKLPPLKQALASKQFKSVYLDRLLSRQKEKQTRGEG